MHHIVTGSSSRESSRKILDGEAIIATLRDLPDAFDASTGAPRPLADLLSNAWRDLADALPTDLNPDDWTLGMSLAQLQAVDRLLVSRMENQSRSAARLADVVEQLESAPAVVSDLVAMVPRLICELGFDRAIISRVDEGLWISQAVYIVDDEDWATEINRVGQESPQKLGPNIHETDIVRRRAGLVVTDVQTDERAHRPIADASHSRSYVAAPILSEGRVVGLLHADRVRHSLDVDADDCTTLLSFSQSLRLVLSRARMSEQLAGLSDDLGDIRRRLATAGSTARSVSLDTSIAQPAVPAAPEDCGPATVNLNPRNAARLTARETEVLGLLAQGMTNSAIARNLVISEGTVKQHVKHVLRKLGAGNRSEAAAMWFRGDVK